MVLRPKNGSERAGRAKDEYKEQTNKSKLQCVCVFVYVVQYTKEYDVIIFSLSLLIHYVLLNLVRSWIWCFEYFISNQQQQPKKKILSHFVLIIIIFAAVAFLQFIYSYLHNNDFIYIYIMWVCVCVRFVRFSLRIFYVFVFSLYISFVHWFDLSLRWIFVFFFSFCTRRCFYLNIGSFRIKY